MPGLRPFFGYYGSKWRLAPKYPAPCFRQIIEPFAGSAGYSLRYPHHRVLLIDKSEEIVAVWRYLVTASQLEIQRLPDVAEHEDVTSIPGLCYEQRLLIGLWLAKAPTRPRRTPSAWMREHSRRGFWGEGVRARLARQVEHIRHWEVVHGDYSDAPEVEATWFVDPPYQRAGVHYPHGANSIDFGTLAQWVKARRGQVVACEAEGATWLPFEPLCSIHSASGTHREASWSNGVGEQQGLFEGVSP